MFQGQNEAGKKAREWLIAHGYDGVDNGGEEYIAFYPEQIKRVDNMKPTSNQDIRYSFGGASAVGADVKSLAEARQMERRGKMPTLDQDAVVTGKNGGTWSSFKASEKYKIDGYTCPENLDEALTWDEFRLLREHLENRKGKTVSIGKRRDTIVSITYYGDDTKIVMLDNRGTIYDIYRVATWAYDGRIANLID